MTGLILIGLAGADQEKIKKLHQRSVLTKIALATIHAGNSKRAGNSARVHTFSNPNKLSHITLICEHLNLL